MRGQDELCVCLMSWQTSAVPSGGFAYQRLFALGRGLLVSFLALTALCTYTLGPYSR